MHLRDLKRWHWVLLSLLMGLAISFTWTRVEPKEPRTMGVPDFVSALTRPPHEGHEWLKDLVVYPPVRTGAGTTAHVANFLVLTQAERGSDEWIYRPTSIVAEVPFVAWRGRGAEPPDPDETILTFLARMQEENEAVRFRYAWERETWAIYLIWTGGSVLVIGLIWPTFISLAAGKGLGFRATPDEYDLERFSKGEPEPAQAARGEMSSQDHEQLAAVQASLEKSLGSGAGGAAAATQAQSAADVRTLDAGPLEELAAQPDEEPKEYQGEFYPVAKPKVHKPEPPH